MKKLTTLLAALALICTSAQAQQFKPTTTADSMGYYIGYTQGAIMGSNINGATDIPDLDVYRAEFIRGVTQSLLADTANTGYIDGLRTGAAMREELMKLYAQGLPCNMELFNKTFAEQVNNPDTTRLAEYMQAVTALIQPVMIRQQQEQLAQQQLAQQQYLDLAAANITAGKAFMDSIKANVPDIQVTPSGLAYRIIKKGEGPNIGPREQGLIYYTGTLINGSQFDATTPGNPIKLGPESVIPGFAEALQLMNKGARYIFYIPQDLAYGMQGPPVIGPGQTLIFDVEVVDIPEQ